MASVAAPEDAEPSTAALKALVAPRTTSKRVLSLRSAEEIEGLQTLFDKGSKVRCPTQGIRALMLNEQMARLAFRNAAVRVYEPPRTSNRVFALVSIEIEREKQGKDKGEKGKDEGEKGKYEGYALYELPLQGIQDHSSDDCGGVHLSTDFPILLSGCHTGSKAIALGSKIYVLGGCCPRNSDCIHPGKSREHFLSEVYCLDTLHPKAGWESCSSMLRPRWVQVVSVVDGKIYVFGGTLLERFSAEVYDPENNKWELLPRMPPKIRNKTGGCVMTPINAVVAAPDGSNKRILVHIALTRSLYAYHVDAGIWSCFDPHFLAHRYISHLFPTSAVLDNILYCYSEYDSKMYSYDFIDRVWCPVEDILGLDDIIYYRASMLLVGGDTLCFFCSYGAAASTRDLLIGCKSCKINADYVTGLRGRFPLSKSSVTREYPRTFMVGGVKPVCVLIL